MLMWNERCTIVHNEKKLTYEGRIRKKYHHLCEYLKRHPDLLPVHKHHRILKASSYFDHQPFANIEMWKRHIDIVLDPTHIPQKAKITQHFRKITTPNNSRKRECTNEKGAVQKNKKIKRIPQRQISTYFRTPTHIPIPTTTPIIDFHASIPTIPIDERRIVSNSPPMIQ